MTFFKKAFALLLCLLCLCCVPAALAEDVSVLFINVGKADAALIFLGQERYLIDAGTKDSHEQLVRVLDVYGVDHLNGIIITHTDKDHAGGLKKLFKSGVTTDRMYAGILHSETDMSDHRTAEAAEKYGIALEWIGAGDAITAADGSVFHILGPLSQDMDNENNNSLVIRLTTSQGDVLFTGDMELNEEAELIEQGLIAPAQVLKVPHHGEGDATSKQFALMVDAQWAIISTNTVEEPDTPDAKIVARLQAAGSTVAVTQDAQVGILVTLRNGQAEAHAINWQ